jgi:elongation factor G
MSRDIRKLRNIGVIAHIDAGKTTVTEKMLFYSGAKHFAGSVDNGTTETDEDEEEQDRGITIYAACVTFNWAGVHINLLDTPGHVDFTAEVERCLRVLDGAVVVFSAREGVEAQSETVWRQAQRYEVPRIVFINKMDREGANFDGVFDEIADRLKATPIAVQIPVGQGPAHAPNPFRGVIDLIDMKMLVFDDQSAGKEFEITDIPSEMEDEALLWRAALVEGLYQFSDPLMELALQEQPIDNRLVQSVLREATIAHQVQPVFCGSALHCIGVQPLLDGVERYLPCPLDLPPIEGQEIQKSDRKKTATSRTAFRNPDDDEPFAGLVFKVLPSKTGDMSWVRVYSGVLRENLRVLNPGKNKKENVAQLWQIRATHRDRDGQIKEVRAGDIVGIIGLRESVTGDTICDAKAPILFESIQFPEPVISMSIEPENATERRKLEEALVMLRRQDPTLTVATDDSGQTILRGMGELHLEVVKNRLLRDFKVDVKFRTPQVSYRETVAGKAEVEGRCDRMVSGQSLFARVKIRMEPQPLEGRPAIVLNQADLTEFPGEFAAVVIEALTDCGQGGGHRSGSPLMNIKVTILEMECREESTDVAFRIAAAMAFDSGLEACGPVLMEPIMRLQVTTPEEFLGDFVGDLQQRRAMIERTETRGDMATIEARAPLKELFGYSSAMRSLSQGRATHSMEPLEYAPAPPEDMERFEM